MSEYPVGYGRPPQHSRFKKGQSGNPKGRPKRTESFAHLARRALSERVAIRENGERRVISKLEAALKQLINKAAAGDQRAIRDIIKLQPLIAEQHKAEDKVVYVFQWADTAEEGTNEDGSDRNSAPEGSGTRAGVSLRSGPTR